jgi:hypothetical protein
MRPVANGKSAEESGSSLGTRKAGIAKLQSANFMPNGRPEAADDGVYQDTVRLIVDSGGCTQSMLLFVDELSRKPQLRLLRMVGTYRNKGMEIWVGIREPVKLKTLLLGTGGVCRVMDPLEHQPEGGERTLKVALTETTAL